MSLNQVFDIAGSGMSAQSIRLNTTSSNIANAETASSSTDDVYRARKPIFSAIQQQMMGGNGGGLTEAGFSRDELQSSGVSVDGIVESDTGLEQRYQPEHPKADQDGFVYYPNVNVVEEMADMMSASRSFQTNVEVMNTAKSMMQRVMTLGQ